MADIQALLSQTRGLKLRVARELGITHGAVSQWRECPPLRVLDVEKITGIPRHELRPDLYPPQDGASA